MRITCTNCGGPHPRWECKKPVKDLIEFMPPSPAMESFGRMVDESRKAIADAFSLAPAKKSTAARKDVRVPEPSVPRSRKAKATLPGSTPGAGMANDVAAPAGTQALPVEPSNTEKLVTDFVVFGTAASIDGQHVDLATALTVRGTPRKRAPKGTFDRKAYQREAAKRRRARQSAEKEAKVSGLTAEYVHAARAAMDAADPSPAKRERRAAKKETKP